MKRSYTSGRLKGGIVGFSFLISAKMKEGGVIRQRINSAPLMEIDALSGGTREG